MPKAKRKPFPKHIVVVDTNILWNEDKSYPVSPLFNIFWEKNAALLPLELIVPATVIGELNFQQFTSANKIIKSISENTDKLCSITQSTYSHRINESVVKKQIASKIDNWLKNIKGSIAEVPIAQINWKSLIDNAIWREAPFTFDPKDKDKEKGFRDSIILETFKDIVTKNSHNQNNIVFVCNDFLLRTTTEDIFKNNKKCLFFESLEEFSSYIQLTQQKLTDVFVKEIQLHARRKFLNSKKGSGLYYTEEIRKTISNKFKSELLTNDIIPIRRRSLFSEDPAAETITLKREKWWATSTQFDKLVEPKEFHWITRVRVARLYGYLNEIDNNSLFSNFQKIQLINFDVKWKADVKAD